MERWMDLIDNLSLRNKLVFTYIILITIPILLMGWRYYGISTVVVSDIATKNTYELVKKNNEIMDVKLSQIMNNISSFITDKDLVNAFTGVRTNDDYSILMLSNKVSDILNKYFLQSQDIYSAQLATSYFVSAPRSLTMTTVKGFIPKDNLIGSKLYATAREQNGKIQWIPTYDFSKMLNLQYLNGVDVDYRYMFSAVVEVNGSYFDDGAYAKLASNVEKPVLILNFKEDFFQQIYRNSIPVEGSYFFVVTKDGQIISHQDPGMLTKKVDFSWLSHAVRQVSGSEQVEIGGEKRIICYTTSRVTGWLSVAVIPPDRLLSPILPAIRTSTFYTAVMFILLSILVAYFISLKITNPISKLMKVIKKTGEGNFDLKMQEEGGWETRELIKRFNTMNEKIQKLIEENYETRIREKEAEITALNLQLDPHFMYNTLNLINLISMENGQDEISDMLISLSTMLKYTVKNRKDLVPFQEDLEYLRSYIFIMTKRFEGKFTVEYDFDPELLKYTVPKFFLQPFVENSLIHGFESLKRMGVLRIRGWLDGEERCFCVEDNGKGFAAERTEEILKRQDGSIGISNVDQRIKMIYGSSYGVEIRSEENIGTTVTIRMPAPAASLPEKGER